MFIGGVQKNKRTATLDCLGPKQAVMPILFYVAAHLLAQLRKHCVADCLNPRQLLLYFSLPHIPIGSKPAAKEHQIWSTYFFEGGKKEAGSRQQIWGK